MPEFPKNQVQIVALAHRMLDGYVLHQADFPSFSYFPLKGKLNAFIYYQRHQAETKGALRVATKSKEEKFAILKRTMKDCLKKSEVDAAANPEKLALIGWGPRHSPQPIAAPSQPVNLRSIAESADTIRLQWLSPQAETGGPVRNYIVQRRQQPEGAGQFGEWSIVGTSLNNEITLTDQPRGIQLEYQVKAVNTGGISTPSNTVAIVL